MAKPRGKKHPRSSLFLLLKTEKITGRKTSLFSNRDVRRGTRLLKMDSRRDPKNKFPISRFEEI